MTEIGILAIDLAKGSFQVCAVAADGAVLYNCVMTRTRLAALLADQEAWLVAMEACATSHHWDGSRSPTVTKYVWCLLRM